MAFFLRLSSFVSVFPDPAKVGTQELFSVLNSQTFRWWCFVEYLSFISLLNVINSNYHIKLYFQFRSQIHLVGKKTQHHFRMVIIQGHCAYSLWGFELLSLTNSTSLGNRSRKTKEANVTCLGSLNAQLSRVLRRRKGTFLVVQWLRLLTSIAGGEGLVSSPGTKIPHEVWQINR